MNLKSILTGSLIVASCHAAAVGQVRPQPTVDMWGVTIRAGASKSATVEQLKREHKLEEGADDFWLVKDRSDGRELGWVSFQEGIVCQAAKTWNLKEGESLDFLRTLHGLLAERTKGRETAVILKAASEATGPATVRDITIRLEDTDFVLHLLDVVHENHRLHSFATIFERIALRSNSRCKGNWNLRTVIPAR